MPTYKITVTQISKKLHNPDDRAYHPEGIYLIKADNEDLALDDFHSRIPIGCLEDYDIQIELKERYLY